jgi:preprotein translocase subunit Sec61beta
MNQENPKRDPNEIDVDPVTVLAVTLAVLLIPLLLVGIFSH